MEKMKHTPEPWALRHDPMNPNPRIFGSDGSLVVIISEGRAFAKQTEANAARIVACVNSCKGINPEAVPELLEALRRIAEHETRADRRAKGMCDISELEDMQRIARLAMDKIDR